MNKESIQSICSDDNNQNYLLDEFQSVLTELPKR